MLIPPNVKTNLNKDIHVKVKIIKLLELKIFIILAKILFMRCEIHDPDLFLGFWSKMAT